MRLIINFPTKTELNYLREDALFEEQFYPTDYYEAAARIIGDAMNALQTTITISTTSETVVNVIRALYRTHQLWERGFILLLAFDGEHFEYDQMARQLFDSPDILDVNGQMLRKLL